MIGIKSFHAMLYESPYWGEPLRPWCERRTDSQLGCQPYSIVPSYSLMIFLVMILSLVLIEIK